MVRCEVLLSIVTLQMSLSQENGLSGVLFPFDLDSPHHLIDPHHLSCDVGFSGEMLEASRVLSFPSVTPIPADVDTIGYLCTKQRWTTICEENFLGMQTQSGRIEPVSIAGSECTDHVSKYRRGEYVGPHYPEPACGWMRTNVNSKDFTVVVEHRVPFDGYNGVEVDPLFVGGTCGESLCETVYSNIKWVSFKPFGLQCTPVRHEGMEIEIQSSGFTNLTKIRGTYIPPMTLAGACRDFKYCGHLGYLTRYGHFFSLPNATLGDPIKDHLSSLPACSPDRKVIRHSSQMDHEAEMLDERLILKADKCETLKDRLLRGERIRASDILYFAPELPGRGVGFQLRNGTFFGRSVDYKRVNNVIAFCISPTNCGVYYQDVDGSPKHWKVRECDPVPRSDQTKDFAGCRWLNGLIITPRGVVYPHRSFFKTMWESTYALEHSVAFDEHIIIRKIDDKIHNLGESDVPHYDEARVTEVFSLIGHSVQSWLVRVFSLLVLFIFLCLTLYGLVRWQRSAVVSATRPRKALHNAEAGQVPLTPVTQVSGGLSIWG